MLYRDHRRLWNTCSTLLNNQRKLIFGEGGNVSSCTKTKILIVFADNTANVIASQLLLILKRIEYVQLKSMHLRLCFYLALCVSMVSGRKVNDVFCVERFTEFEVVNMHFVFFFQHHKQVCESDLHLNLYLVIDNAQASSRWIKYKQINYNLYFKNFYIYIYNQHRSANFLPVVYTGYRIT